MRDQIWDVVIVGAGAAGLLASAAAASRGRRTLLLEKNRKLGVKILISGGTRCNVTHDTNQAGIAAGFPRYQGKFLRSSLAAFPPDRIRTLLDEEGVATKSESTGKVFPVSDRAIDVRDALVSFARKQGTVIEREVAVRSIERAATGFAISVVSSQQQSSDVIHAASVIVACGGQSYAGCGTTGDGYAWARNLGHSIVQPVPALTPIKSKSQWLYDHSGLTLPDVGLKVAKLSLLNNSEVPKKAILDQEQGSLLLTHFGMSGPIALNVSRTITRSMDRNKLVLVVDFLPKMTFDSLLQSWKATGESDGKRIVSNLLSDHLPRKLAATLLAQANIPLDRRCAEFSKSEMQSLVRQLKSKVVDVSGTLGFDKAEVTAGGVALDEVDSKSLESKLVPGLYFVGEVLDIDGQIGGYNFQAAFSTGWTAGSAASG